MKILVIEDKKSIRSEICDFFKMENCEILEAYDGLEGLVKAMKHLPDVVISDVKMPVINGVQFYKFLRMNPKTANIPVILFTGMLDEVQKDVALKLGVKHYFVKPFNMEYVYDTVKSLAG